MCVSPQFQQKHHKGVNVTPKAYTNNMKTYRLPDKFGPFLKHKVKPNAIKYGTLYNLELDIDVPKEQRRIMRVYLPENYDVNKRFAVMYMCDVQNAVDRYLTAYGEWNIDEHMHELLEEGYESFIIAGLDCPKKPANRMREYVLDSAPFNGRMKFARSYGLDYAKCIIEVIKPLVDQYFLTLPDKEHTAFGGSSMGGLCAFDMVSLFPDVFSFALSFSPAFFVLNKKKYELEVKNRNFVVNDQKYFFFTGRQDLDAQIYPGTIEMYEYMKSLGYDDKHVQIIVDESMGHCEASWSLYFTDAAKFWQGVK